MNRLSVWTVAALLEAALFITNSDELSAEHQEAVLDDFITRLVGAEGG